MPTSPDTCVISSSKALLKAQGPTNKTKQTTDSTLVVCRVGGGVGEGRGVKYTQMVTRSGEHTMQCLDDIENCMILLTTVSP